MKRVVQSVDKRKKFNSTMISKELDIQSIIIGSPDKNQQTEAKTPNDGNNQMTKIHDQK